MKNHHKNFVTGADIRDRENSVYVKRVEEDEWIDEIREAKVSRAYALIAHRQMGKSSFLNRLCDDLEGQDWAVARADLRFAANKEILTEGEFALVVAEQLLQGSLPDEELHDKVKHLEALTDREVGANSNSIYRCLWDACNVSIASGKPVLFVVDEFESVSHLGPYVQMLFELTLELNNTGRSSPIIWIYAGTQPIETLIEAEGADPSRYTNFTALRLPDIGVNNEEHIAELASGLSFNSPNPIEVVQEVLKETAGQPLLTQKILDLLEREHIRRRPIDVSRILDSDELLNSSHFKYVEKQLQIHGKYARQALYAYQKMLDGSSFNNIPELTTDLNHAEVRRTLVQSGLVSISRDGTLSIRSPLYRRVFDRGWVNKAMRQVYTGSSSISRAIPKASAAQDDQVKIGVINAGGTMGFDFRYGRVVAPNKGVYWYLDDPEIVHSTILVDLDPGFEPLDGVDVSPEQWKQISGLIFAEMHSGYAGFIVVMGTDSLAYAASATSFALGRDLPVPVIFTGSQAPHAMHHADARVNLLRSIEVIQRLGSRLTEVCVLFGEDVFRAVRVEKYNDYRFNGFHSPSFPPLATIGEVPKLTNVRDRIVPRKSASRNVEAKIYTDFDNDVFRMSLYPGLKGQTLMGMLEANPPSGLVLECLGLGNIPSRGEYDLLPVFDWCREKNIPVLLTGRYPIAEEFVDQYDAAMAPRDRGAMSAGNMTPAAALTKFMWVLARVKDEASRVSSLAEPDARRARIEAFFSESYVGEQDGINET